MHPAIIQRLALVHPEELRRTARRERALPLVGGRRDRAKDERHRHRRIRFASTLLRRDRATGTRHNAV